MIAKKELRLKTKINTKNTIESGNISAESACQGRYYGAARATGPACVGRVVCGRSFLGCGKNQILRFNPILTDLFQTNLNGRENSECLAFQK